MRKLVAFTVLACLVMGFVQSCTKQSTEETTQLYADDEIDKPDIQRPGGGGGN